MGSHLNESSYTEPIPLIETVVFKNIRTILPFAVFIPALRAVRVRPWINRLFERYSVVRCLANAIRLHGRPIFKNPVVLICEKG